MIQEEPKSVLETRTDNCYRIVLTQVKSGLKRWKVDFDTREGMIEYLKKHYDLGNPGQKKEIIPIARAFGKALRKSEPTDPYKVESAFGDIMSYMNKIIPRW